MRSLTSSRPVWSASSTARACGQVEVVVGDVTPHGRPEHPVEPRADPALLGVLRRPCAPAGRSPCRPRCARPRAAVSSAAGCGSRRRRPRRLVAQLLADGGQLLAQQELALLLLHAVGDVLADALADLQLGEELLGPRQDQLDARAAARWPRGWSACDRWTSLRPRRGGVGQRPGIGDRCAGSRAGAGSDAPPAMSSSTTRSSRASSSTRGARVGRRSRRRPRPRGRDRSLTTPAPRRARC